MRKLLFSLLFISSLHAVTRMVTSTSNDSNVAGTLPNAMKNAVSGDIIDCSMIGGGTIDLSILPNIKSLPAIIGTLTITAPTGNPVTITGGGVCQIFSAGTGTVILQNFNLQNGVSQGGSGGNGSGGGGGGAGGGGGLYVHNGANVAITGVQFTTCQARGGAGGVGAAGGGGGGGGGYGDTLNTNAGGAGGAAGGGGGGGGNTSGGAGGAANVVGGAGTYFGGGGGGGGGVGAVGGTSGANGGGTASGANGGGGAGIGGSGGAASGTTGGAGGNGTGADAGFSGGGGGGGAIGGAGKGTGGGGGANTTVGGAGGVDGGGGGGGGAGGAGGKGGFGGGGGGGTAGGGTIFGGGSGANPGGGGGAGMGGAIFIQNGGQLEVQDGLTLTGNSVTAGAPGGSSLGIDIFLRSGGSLVFNNANAPITIPNPIISDLNAGGGGTGGGLTMQGSNTVILPNGSNYTGNTFFKGGTIQIASDSALGSLAPITNLMFSGGTLRATNTFMIDPTRTITLTGNGTFNVDALQVLTIDNSTNPITGAGTLIKSGAGTLILQGTGTNTYSGGTAINGGILETNADKYLGSTSAPITFNGGTLQMDSGYTTTARPIQVSGPGTIDMQGQTVTLSGVVSGGGNLTVGAAAAGTLILTGNNTFSGTDTVATTSTLQGNSASLTGNINVTASAFLIFNQTTTGTYSKVLSGSGSFTKIGAGTLIMTGNSSPFAGPIVVTAGGLQVDGTLGGSSLMSAAGTILSGKGTYSIPNVTANGFVQPGDNSSVGQMNFTGNLTFSGTSELDININPTQADFVFVGGTFTENGTIVLAPLPGFYGFGFTYPIIQAGAYAGNFAHIAVTDPNFILTLERIGNTTFAEVRVLEPFANFPAANDNIQSVANNLDAISVSGSLNLNSPLAQAIDSLRGSTVKEINDALDQLHPAIFSGFYDLQAEVGDQIISFFHRKPMPVCGCNGRGRTWVELYGDWINQKDMGIEVGFNAYSKGVAAGADWEVIDNLVVGFGGAWNHTEFHWHDERGHGDLDGFFAGTYLDYTAESFYVGASILAGRDFFNTFRKITFATVNEDARGNYCGLDILSQLAATYFLGPDRCCLLPYLNLDFFYLNQRAFEEKNAPGLNLHVESNSGATMRSEIGLGLQVIDRNRNETICISPQVAMGWASIFPMFRQKYTSTFEGQTIPFQVVGWDHTWQLLTVRFGLSVSYFCYLFSGEYVVELAPHSTSLFNQRANFRFDFSW